VRWTWPGYRRSLSPRSPRTWGSASRVCAAGWVQADVDNGHKEGLTKDQRAELVRLRREKRVPEMVGEILKRATAYFARENVLPK
jgi:transposase-like protein